LRFRHFRQSVTCDRCGHSDIAWAKSAKGKWYLAPIVLVGGEEFVDAHRFHSAECAAFAAERAKEAARLPHDIKFATLVGEARDKIVEALDDAVDPGVDYLLDMAAALVEADEADDRRAEVVKLRRAAKALAGNKFPTSLL
jgi:hypothetical protein